MAIYEKLEELYATLPTIPCKRFCRSTCGPILIPKIEAKRLEGKRGYLEVESGFKGAKRVSLPAPEVIQTEFIGLRPRMNSLDCVFLDSLLGNCMAYKIRPLVCRLFGCMDEPLMRCPYGCKPERWVSAQECRGLYERILEIQRG